MKNIKNNISFKVSKSMCEKSFRPKIDISFSLSTEDIQDIISLHGEGIASQALGDLILSAIKNSGSDK
jgi:hypothetical protein